MQFHLAEAQSVFLVSLYKPIVMALVVGAWAYLATKLDKDAASHFLPREAWNTAQMGAAVIGVLLWLLIPWFWLGMALALLIQGAAIGAYVAFRNAKVPPNAKWTLSAESFKKKHDAKITAQAQARATIKLCRPDGSRLEVPAGESPEAQAHARFEEVMEFVLPRKAERLDLTIAGQGQTALTVTIDGVRYSQPPIDGRLALALVDYLKQPAGLDVADRRRRQSGNLTIDAGPLGRHVLVLTTAGSTRELNLTARLNPSNRMVLSLEKMGLIDSQRKQLEPVIAVPEGVVLVACPAHNGLTTTLYSFASLHDPYTRSVVTLEDEIEYEIEGVNHHQIPPGADAQAINQKLAGLLRQDPQVVMLSRVADIQTAKLAAQTAKDKRVYIGIRQDDTFGTLRAWSKAIGDPKLAADSLTAIVAQRLVRRLCNTCRLPYRPDPAALRKLNLPPERVSQLFKQSGQIKINDQLQPCPTCMGLAYQGRVGIFEVMVLDDEARRYIVANQLDQLRSYLRKQKMLWLQEAALLKVVDGSTSIAELTRALAPSAGA